MSILAVLWAIIGAIVGASLWAGITYLTGYQIGWMAIGVGSMVGMGARVAGGEGKPMALLCAGLALAAMFIGNVMAIQIALDKAVEDWADEFSTPEDYTESFRAADEFVMSTPEEAYPAFILEHTDISEASDPEAVTEEEIALFLEVIAPDIRRFQKERPTYSVWRDRMEVDVKEALMDGTDITGYIIDSFGIIDALFLFLGLGAAMRIVGEWD